LRHLAGVTVVGTLVAVMPSHSAQAQSRPGTTDEALQKRLKKFPAADTDGDGVLTESEARAARKAGRSAKSAGPDATGPGSAVPTYANISYGPHERNVLDFWRAATNGPTPVLVFFHGGSFKGGDKAAVQARPIFQECLAAGISVVSANYRFSFDRPFPAPMHDGARVVQFVRFKAKEWNLDHARVALSGSSAGATLALWIALHDDLAEPGSADPVARESSRVICATPHSGTAGLTSDYFQQHAGVTKLGAALWQLFGAGSQAGFESTEKRQLQREASPLSHATKDDPPLFLTYAGVPSEAPFATDAPQRDWIHHVSLGLPLKAKYDALGRECEIRHRGTPADPGAEIAFLKRHLLSGGAVRGAP
jgi:acetyl esterase/lipase